MEEDQNEEAVVEVKLETVVERVIDEFDDVASITIDHLSTYECPSIMRIKAYTGEADSFEDDLQLFSSDQQIALDRDDQTLLVPFSTIASFDGPVTWDTESQTTIYMDENVHGAQPLQFENGLAYVQDKLDNPDQWELGRDTISLERIRNYTD